MEQLIRFIFDIQTAYAQVQNRDSDLASQTGDQVQTLFVNFLSAIPLWITGGLVIILSFVLAKIVKSSVENRMSAEGLEEQHQEIQIVASRTAGTVVLAVGITTGLKIMGLDLTSVLAAGAFGIGFAMKDIIMNFLAGIIVLLQRQFTIGDWIKINGTLGIIQEIQSRYTVLKTFDGTKVIIPNADLFKKQVISLTSNPYRRFSIHLAVDFYYDLKEVTQVIHQAIRKVPQILQNPKPGVHILEPGSYFNKLKIHCWVESKKGILGARTQLMQKLHEEFYARGWAWPYPTHTLVYDKDRPADVNLRAQEYIQKYKDQPENEMQREQQLINIQQQTLANSINQPVTTNPSPVSFPINKNPVAQTPENQGMVNTVPMNETPVIQLPENQANTAPIPMNPEPATQINPTMPNQVSPTLQSSGIQAQNPQTPQIQNIQSQIEAGNSPQLPPQKTEDPKPVSALFTTSPQEMIESDIPAWLKQKEQ